MAGKDSTTEPHLSVGSTAQTEAPSQEQSRTPSLRVLFTLWLCNKGCRQPLSLSLSSLGDGSTTAAQAGTTPSALRLQAPKSWNPKPVLPRKVSLKTLPWG